MNWRTYRKAIMAAAAAGLSAWAASVTAHASTGATVVAVVLAVVGSFGSVYAIPNDRGPAPVTVQR